MAEIKNTTDTENRVKLIRARVAMNQIKRVQIAAEIGVSEMTVYRWMKDRIEDHIARIEAALDAIEEREGGADD